MDDYELNRRTAIPRRLFNPPGASGNRVHHPRNIDTGGKMAPNQADEFQNEEFEGASPPVQIDYDDILGHTVMITVLEIRPEVETREYGTALNVPDVDLVDLDTDEVYEGALLFGALLSQQLRRKVGKKVVGVFGQGQAQGKKSPPWIILPMTEEDQKKAQAYVRGAASNGKAPF